MAVYPRIRVERIALDAERGFPGNLKGLKIVQLSDLHIRRYGVREKRMVKLVNREDADFVFITGDFVVNYSNRFSACVRTLKELRSKSGIFAVLGNADHTFKPEESYHRLIEALTDVPVTLLQNQNLRLLYRGEGLWLLGVDDPFFLFDDFEEAVKGVQFSEPTILLAHSPDILFPRGDALSINLLDSGRKEDYFKTWGWAETTYFGPKNGGVYFTKDGTHTLRVQSRQDGVFIDAILLNPYQELDDLLKAKRFEAMERLLRSEGVQRVHPDLVVIPADAVDKERMHGKWRSRQDSMALFGVRLDDLPARRKWQYQPLVEPRDYFEVDFAARSGVGYRLWMRMKAFRGSPKNDSVYAQFSDAVDESGRQRYRIGRPAHAKSRLKDVNLILTGHTHGGQVKIPFYGPVDTLTSIGKRYTSGLYRTGKSLIYVSRGLGTSDIPIRFRCPPEIGIFQFC
jgi:predicted MPP superfamily phosphohydrolase